MTIRSSSLFFFFLFFSFFLSLSQDIEDLKLSMDGVESALWVFTNAYGRNDNNDDNDNNNKTLLEREPLVHTRARCAVQKPS